VCSIVAAEGRVLAVPNGQFQAGRFIEVRFGRGKRDVTGHDNGSIITYEHPQHVARR
jgi:hypothetical protein